ncbi:MAG: VOC family protein [Proteobacteria bacterium]|nr:VOC family protein [Pseudomonadota bacterium]
MAVKAERLDHLVLTVRDVEKSLAFYERVLGLRPRAYKPGRPALHFGVQKINLQPERSDAAPVAGAPTPGSADLCFITRAAPELVARHLAACGVAVEAGPVARQGALGAMTSIYFRDPDGNLIEVATYGEDAPEPPA